MIVYQKLCSIILGLILTNLWSIAQEKPEKLKISINEIEEIITPVEIGQKIENLDNFLPIASWKGIPVGAVYADPAMNPAERALDVISRLSFEEKLKLTGGWSFMYFPAIERLGLRPVSMADASQGIRLKAIVAKGNSTSFPGMLSLAATWNPQLAAKFGKAIGEECHALGIDVMLGPGINMQRFSVSGRNFEYMGEDPDLTSEIAKSYVKGLQSQNIIATAKHYIGNDQEFVRHLANCIIDERTLREIYLPPWEAVIKEAGIKAIMTGNNMVSGIPCCMSKPLEADLLRKEYGFQGVIMSDWSNTGYYSEKLPLTLTSGHSLYMSNNQGFAKYIKTEISKSPERKFEIEIMLEKMIFHNLCTFFGMGVYDRVPQDKSYENKFEEHKLLARQCATESICLLKNENNILPVAKNKIIMMMGSSEIHSGTGSGFVDGYDHVTYADGMKKVYGNSFTYVEKPDDKAIREAGVVLFLLNKGAGEGYDVPFEEPKDQTKELMRISMLNKNVIVIISSANPMAMPWLKNVKGLIWAFMLGQERGNALAAVISGEVNPSGKLPFTIEKSFSDSQDPDFNHFGNTPYFFGHHPQYRSYWIGEAEKTDNIFHLYVKPHEYVKIPYEEGIFMGYRWYEKKQIPVQFPFGFGLSYTQFDYSDLKVTNQTNNGNISVSFIVKNTGKKAGGDVTQLYLADKVCSVPRPVKELKGFKKVYLNPGESQKITLDLTSHDFAYWDTTIRNWKVEAGEFEILIGASVNDIRLKSSIEIL